MEVKFSDIPGFMENLKNNNPERYEKIMKTKKNGVSMKKNLSSYPEVMTMHEVCEVTGLKDTTIRDLVQNGIIPGRKDGRVYRFLRSAIETFCDCYWN